MSIFTSPNCQHAIRIFGEDGVERECKKHGMEPLGEVFSQVSICQDSDCEKPTLVSDATEVLVLALRGIAERSAERFWVTLIFQNFTKPSSEHS